MMTNPTQNDVLTLCEAMGFCDKFYKNVPIHKHPDWMSPIEVNSWKDGWVRARNTLTAGVR